MYNDDCIYTPDVVVLKSDTSLSQPLPEADWMKLDVITCAAPRLEKACNRDGSWTIQPYDARELKVIHVKRFKRIMEIASAYSMYWDYAPVTLDEILAVQRDKQPETVDSVNDTPVDEKRAEDMTDGEFRRKTALVQRRRGCDEGTVYLVGNARQH